MNTYYLKRVRALFTVQNVPLHTQRHNMKAWAKSIRQLDKGWILSVPLKRQNKGPVTTGV